MEKLQRPGLEPVAFSILRPLFLSAIFLSAFLTSQYLGPIAKDLAQLEGALRLRANVDRISFGFPSGFDFRISNFPSHDPGFSYGHC